jgi:hypothetical protein
LTARRVERLRADDDALEWLEFGPVHLQHSCEAAGAPDCPRIGQPREEWSVRWEGGDWDDRWALRSAPSDQ